MIVERTLFLRIETKQTWTLYFGGTSDLIQLAESAMPCHPQMAQSSSIISAPSHSWWSWIRFNSIQTRMCDVWYWRGFRIRWRHSQVREYNEWPCYYDSPNQVDKHSHYFDWTLNVAKKGDIGGPRTVEHMLDIYRLICIWKGPTDSNALNLCMQCYGPAKINRFGSNMMVVNIHLRNEW